MPGNPTHYRRRKAGLCPGCGDDPGEFASCEACRRADRKKQERYKEKRKARRAAINANAREWYAARTAKGRCGKCGERLRTDGGCGVCNYLKRVSERGGDLQSLR